MSIFEYDKELEEKKLRKAEFEAGRTQRRSKYGAKRPKPGQAAPAKKK